MASSSEGGGSGISNNGLLYHEVETMNLQKSAVHCVRMVLQRPAFREHSFNLIGVGIHERNRMSQVSETGDFQPEVPFDSMFLDGFDIQVVQEALEAWRLQAIPLDKEAQIDPQMENAVICHLESDWYFKGLGHWFCIRKVNGEWYNFDCLFPAPHHLSSRSLYPVPHHISEPLLVSLYSIKESCSIYRVKGNFPPDYYGSSGFRTSFECYGFRGQWLSPEDAESLFNSDVFGDEEFIEPSTEYDMDVSFLGL